MTRIGLLYDPHIIADPDRRPHDGVDVVKRAMTKLAEVNVDWTVIGGDLRSLVSRDPTKVDWGRWDGNPDDYYYRSDFERAKALFDEYLGEYYVIRGNNDRPLGVFREVFPADEYPQYFHMTRDGARYVFLDSNPSQGYHHLQDTQNFVSSPQLSMLERLMDDDPTVPTFVFVHAPVAKHTEITEDWETAMGPGYRLTLNHLSVQRVLERGNTVFVNSGHYYPDNGRGAKTVQGVEYVLARHLVHSPDPAYAGDVRWLDVDTEENTASVHYYDVGADEDGVITQRSW